MTIANNLLTTKHLFLGDKTSHCSVLQYLSFGNSCYQWDQFIYINILQQNKCHIRNKYNKKDYTYTSGMLGKEVSLNVTDICGMSTLSGNKCNLLIIANTT